MRTGGQYDYFLPQFQVYIHKTHERPTKTLQTYIFLLYSGICSLLANKSSLIYRCNVDIILYVIT